MHVVFLSGGVASYVAGLRVAEQHGVDDLVLLFTDTSTEDESTYRFLRDGAADIGGRLVWLRDGEEITPERAMSGRGKLYLYAPERI